ncbi:MAG TPA: hypothetical protein VLQ45_32085 [Thermoanaerobaculia bacterium]|nr:hypothetical protein [Thermoanaerobaculia bacterium]
MKMFSRICLVAAVVCSLMFVTSPVANAIPRGDSQPEARAESGWLGAAFDWFQNLLARGEQPRDRREGKPSTTKGRYPTNGSCIDPQGNPRYWCI